MGTRPSVTLYPSATAAVDTSTAFDWVNPSNALGAPNGTYASADLSGATIGDGTDTQNYTFTVDSALNTCRISAFRYTFMNVSSPGATLNDVYGWTIQPMNSGGSVVGEPENTHEFGGSARNAGSRTYQFPEGPLGTTLFSSGAVLGSQAQTFATWGGFRLWPSRVSLATSNFPIQFDALKVDIFYTPVDSGATSTSIAPTAASTTEIAAASLGLTVPSGLEEKAWTNPANASTSNTTRATVGPSVDGGGLATSGYVTRFLKYVFPSGLLTAAASRYPRELRVVCNMQATYNGENLDSGFVDEENPLLAEMFALLDNLLLLDSSGNILMQLQDPVYDRDPWGSKTWRLAWALSISTGGASTIDRPTQFVLDVSGMTPSQVADMQANGFQVVFRFRCDRVNLSNAGGFVASELAVNHASFTLSHDASEPSLPPLLPSDTDLPSRPSGRSSNRTRRGAGRWMAPIR